jgi:GlpG protein
LRQIGTLSGEREARDLADHLLTLGVATRLRPEPDGWGVWVLDENRLPLARQEFEAYLSRPDDLRFRSATRSAQAIRRESDKLESNYRKNMRHVSNTWGRTPIRRRPVTVLLIAACVVVFLLLNWDRTAFVTENALAFSAFRFNPRTGQVVLGGFEDILHGEVWRLITPIFMHFGPMHLLFDVWALSMFGTLIETRRGTQTLALLVLISAITSDLGQFLYFINFTGRIHIFGGMSGVVYALFGYVWMKGRFEPEQGMILHPSSVQIMLFWLVICMTGALGNIANAAHVVGLATGVACGLARL